MSTPCALRFQEIRLRPLCFETRNRWGAVKTRVRTRPSSPLRYAVVERGCKKRRHNYIPLPLVRPEDRICVT